MFRRLNPLSWGRHRSQVSEDGQPDIQLVRMLASQISIPSRAGRVLGEVEAFARLDPKARRAELPRMYLLLGQYLMNMDPVRTLTRAQVREIACTNFPALAEEPSFQIIFAPPERQEVLLCRTLLLDVIDRAMLVLGEGAKLSAVRAWIERSPEPASETEREGAEHPAILEVPEQLSRPDNDAAWVAAFMDVSPTIFEQLHVGLGEATARIYDGAYTQMARRYGGLETFPIVVRLLPDGLLDAERIQSVAHHETMSRVQGALSEAQQSALESATQLQAVLGTVGEGIATVDAEHRFVLVNRETERLFGYASEDLLGRPITSLLDGIDVAFSESLGKRIQIEGRRRDGSTFPVEVCVNETRISGRLFYTAAMRDVTTRLRYERQLLEAKEHAEEITRLKTAFIANMSHEFRTPLAGIMGAVDILVGEIPDPLQEFAEVIADSGRRLLSTFDSVLEFAVLESGDAQVRLKPVPIVPHLQAAVQRFSARALSKGLTLSIDVPTVSDDAPPSEGLIVIADPECVDRILDRLLENAIRFTHAGTVQLSARVTNGLACIEVRDTGIGIGPTFLPHAFDEFRQESTGDARKHEGTGLGLAIARRLADQMGATLEAESTPGKGSTFRLSLPMAKPEPVTAKLPRSAPSRHIEQ